MNKPEVGQIIYSLNVGNAARYTKSVLTPMVVKKVGRKYFIIGEEGRASNMDTQFYIETWKQNTEYSASQILYKSEQDYEDEKESKEIIENITGFFGIYGCRNKISLAALKTIKGIIDEFK